MKKIGSLISSVATPIARVFNMPCVDPVTGDLRPDSPCAKVRDDLDAGHWRDAFYDFIWRKNGVEQINMKDWLIIHQIGVTAETYKEALAAIDDGETIAITCQLRQQQGPPSIPTSGRQRPQPQPTTSEKKQ